MERLFQWLDGFKSGNMVRAAFGEPRQEAGNTVIPVATVASGVGDWSTKPEGQAEDGRPPQEGAITFARPLAVITVGRDGVHVHEVVDRTVLSVTGMSLIALLTYLVYRLLTPVLRRRAL